MASMVERPSAFSFSTAAKACPREENRATDQGSRARSEKKARGGMLGTRTASFRVLAPPALSAGDAEAEEGPSTTGPNTGPC